MNRLNNTEPLRAVSAAPEELGSLRISIGLFGAPLAWIIQFFVSEPLAAQACYPHLVPLSAPMLSGLPFILISVGVVCFSVALLSGFVAWRSWRQTEMNRTTKGSANSESGGSRNQFLAMLGLMSSFIFIIAILFNLCAVWLVSPCSSWY